MPSAIEFGRRARTGDNTMDDAPVWERDGTDWPNREASRFVRAAGMLWHVQCAGTGPVVLLLHGTGASTHSWRSLFPLLKADFTVIAPDLPGHGFTQTPPREFLSLPGMSRAVSSLLHALDGRPAIVVGHSAGAAIAARMAIDGMIEPKAIVSVNGALLPLSGMAGHVFGPLARVFAMLPVVPRLFSWHALDRRVIARLIADTGSKIDDAGIDYYCRLATRSGHVGAALGMMANWNLHRLEADLPRLKIPLVLAAGTKDRTIPPAEARRIRRLLPSARIVPLEGLGHLAHEEKPELVADIIVETARAAGVLQSDGGRHA